MPCDSVQKTSVNLDVADIGLLAAALETLGYQVTMQTAGALRATHRDHGDVAYDAAKKSLTTTTRYGQAPQNANEIKVAYSTQVVNKIATRFGWSVNATKATAGEAAHFQAKKRGF